MLVLNLEKTIQLNIKTDNLNPRFDLDNQYKKVDNTCKHLGVRLDWKLTFKTHISHVVKKLSKQCWIISKLRHYVSRSKLLNYYNTNVNSIIQYGILVYGCCSYSSLFPIFFITKENFENTLPKKAGRLQWPVYKQYNTLCLRISFILIAQICSQISEWTSLYQFL